jgi:hypothetical protein
MLTVQYRAQKKSYFVAPIHTPGCGNNRFVIVAHLLLFQNFSINNKLGIVFKYDVKQKKRMRYLIYEIIPPKPSHVLIDLNFL